MNTYGYAMGSDYAMGSSAFSGTGLLSTLSTFFVLFLIFYLCYEIISFITVIYAYIFEGIALHTIAKRRAISKPWLAWIPLAKFWLLGEIASDYDRQNGKNKKWGKKIITSFILCYSSLFIAIALLVVGMVFSESNPMTAIVILLVALLFDLVALIFSLIYCITVYTCIYKVFASTAGKLAWVYLLLAIFVPLSLPICLFIFRKKGYERMPVDDLVVEKITS